MGITGMEASYVELEVLKFRVLLRILPALRGLGGTKSQPPLPPQPCPLPEPSKPKPPCPGGKDYNKRLKNKDRQLCLQPLSPKPLLQPCPQPPKPQPPPPQQQQQLLLLRQPPPKKPPPPPKNPLNL